MHTIVIHLYENMDDWHIIEPMFYNVQSNMELSFFYGENKGEFLSCEKLLVQVSEYLQYKDIDQWQLLIITHIPEYKKSFGRLSSYLHEFKEQLINPLKETGHEPQNEIVLVLDSINKQADYSPKDDSISNIWWQLDIHGYLKQPIKNIDKMPVSHLFTQRELETIDEAWGKPLNLHDAGIINSPNKEFMAELNRRVDHTFTHFDSILAEKIKHSSKKTKEFHYDLITEKQLKLIKSSFFTQIKKVILPPLNDSLATFKPSNLLLDILRNTLSLNWYKSSFQIFRIEISNMSLRLRLTDLLKLSMLINLLTINSNILSRFSRGSVHDIQVTIDKERMQNLIVNYNTCLEIAEQNIKDKLLDRQNMFINKFNRPDSFPHSISSLTKVDIPEPALSSISYSALNFIYDWETYINDVETQLQEREEEINQKVKEGIRDLSIYKRENVITITENKVELSEYLSTIHDDIKKTVTEIDKISTSKESAQDKWKKFISDKNDHVRYLIKQLPSKKTWWLTLLIVTIFMCAPFITTHYGRVSEGLYTSPIFILLLLTLLVLSTVFISGKAISISLKTFITDTRYKKNNCYSKQETALANYNKYLNKVFQLYRLRRQYKYLNDQFTQFKQKNVSYRYHQTKIEEHKKIINRLLTLVSDRNLAPDRRHCEALLEHKFKVTKSVLDNPIYSPLEYQFNAQREAHKLKMNIGNSVDTIIVRGLNPLSELQFSVDKVYRL
ncbi:hypothetical protein CIB95_07800 [Lottiidibacillus patelloidae]|uniref:Uncharacterized protein n=1 Tax=Lottiidibacillus patelloidae TaxID=2670334 RepID=A0A263BW01_9BACI|nr:hypothetical protein [Lottiidibacillus patelloidae]OZM57356.1 hypothetical protein CIB95_07800 [Lottiidibacillus patelloidae]